MSVAVRGDDFRTSLERAHWESEGYKVPRLAFGDACAPGYEVSAQVPSRSTDDLSFAFDGIIGVDVLSTFDMYFDYDSGRIGLRR